MWLQARECPEEARDSVPKFSRGILILLTLLESEQGRISLWCVKFVALHNNSILIIHSDCLLGKTLPGNEELSEGLWVLPIDTGVPRSQWCLELHQLRLVCVLCGNVEYTWEENRDTFNDSPPFEQNGIHSAFGYLE